jgi:hypothetical protein
MLREEKKLEGLDVHQIILLNWMLKIQGVEDGLDSTDIGYKPLAGFCECGGEHSSSIIVFT